MNKEEYNNLESLKRINKQIEWERWKVNGMYVFQRKYIRDRKKKEENEMLWRQELHRLMKLKYKLMCERVKHES